jgi:hypothetical protein
MQERTTRAGDEDIHPVQVEAWSRMSFDEKWELAKMAQRMVIDAARRRIRRDHPEYSDEELQSELAKFLISEWDKITDRCR